jgi:hypothetical protein
MTITTILIQCLRDIAGDHPKSAATIEMAADRMGLLSELLGQCLPLVKQAARDPFIDSSINFACMKLAKQIEENTK